MCLEASVAHPAPLSSPLLPSHSHDASLLPVFRHVRLEIIPLPQHLRPLSLTASPKLTSRSTQLDKNNLSLQCSKMPPQKRSLDALEKVSREAKDCYLGQPKT